MVLETSHISAFLFIFEALCQLPGKEGRNTSFENYPLKLELFPPQQSCCIPGIQLSEVHPTQSYFNEYKIFLCDKNIKGK